MGKRLNIHDFIIRSNEVHNNKYDYSKVIYKNNKTKIKIICPKHGEFYQLPSHHLNMRNGCMGCSPYLKLDTNEFIKRSSQVHKNKYNYSLVNYRNISTKVTIKCQIHGDFEQSPDSHLKGHGCYKCGQGNDIIEFIEKSKKLYGDKFDYSKTKYINTSTKIIVTCKIHGDISVSVGNFLYKESGCRFCEVKSYNKLNFFIEDANKIHNSKYKYEIINDLNKLSKIKIICPTHGYFIQRIDSHLRGTSCRKCKDNDRKIELSILLSNFNKIHNNKYDYSNLDYINSVTKIKIVCKNHGIFTQTPKSHLNGNGCPKCYQSSGEKIISNLLNSNNIEYKTQHKFPNCRNIKELSFDFYIPEKNTCIEFDGIQHFKPIDYFGGLDGFNKTKKRDEIKNRFCKENNIKLIRISDRNKIEEMLKFLI